MKVRLTFFFLFYFSIVAVLGQSHNYDKTSDHAHDFGTENHITQRKHAIHYLNGLTLLPDAITESHEGKQLNFINTIGVSYQYQFDPKFAAMVITDLEMESYMLRSNEELYFRENVLLVVLAGSYEPTQHLEIFAGAGVEFESSQNLAVARFGIEYHFHIANDWYVSPELTMDITDLQYTYTGAFKFTRKFGKILTH
ncbi:hypothetical protein [Salibacter sp.]|uniref:hypothetical protein n=1 Tax=Salibacter sp. TaxID=2010995 RepID=UPI002870A7E5|nr:hypothetical protein [Salibacter sp.]MDR9398559.1 hypothetical protein [Salibacter sp.]MDR9487627.1 hypothetical protein [Salibacter sp.]